MNKHRLLLAVFFFFFRSTSAVDFVFNGFNSSVVSLYGNATIESRILTLTNDTTFSIGRALYSSRIRAKHPNSSSVIPFSTSFIFSMAPFRNQGAGHGIVFLFVPHTGIEGTTAAQNLGFLNRTNSGLPGNHVFGVEFDVFRNQEFNDISDNHVGIDVNSLTSVSSHNAGYWPDGSDGADESFEELPLNNGRNYQVWIDYADFQINVTMAPAGTRRPGRPLLNIPLNLSDVFEDEMYVGFTAATGALVESHRILAWSFSNSNFSLSEALVTRGLPSFELPPTPIFRSTAFIAGMTVSLFLLLVISIVISLFLIKRTRRKRRERAEIEDWESEYWPHRIAYQEIEAATNNFSDQNVIGIGGNGKVYKGVMAGGIEIAVKRISHENSDGARQFLSEISTLGRLKHRNLVGLRGWCKKERGSLVLVYDFMANGSLEKWVFDVDESKTLGFQERLRILKEVANGVLYLHEGWEAKVLHRDIKASNVLLDKEMNAKLGDFGLARMHSHSLQTANTTRVVGTVGYMAPEVVKTGRASTQTDVFGFGVLILEVMCGRRPVEEGKPPLVDWVWGMMGQAGVRPVRLIEALDERLRLKEGFDEEMGERVLVLGLACVNPDPRRRPTIRQVLKFLEGKRETDESEVGGEDNMEVYLLNQMKGRDVWNEFGDGSHPTFEELREGLSSTMSLSWSNSIVEGEGMLGNGDHGGEASDEVHVQLV